MAEKANSAHTLAVDCIYTALVELMDKRAYQDISITDITKRAGVSRMAYYRNYQTKDEILTKRLDVTLSAFEERLMTDEGLSPEQFVEAFFKWFQKEPIIQRIVAAGLTDALIDRHKRFMGSVYEKKFGWDLSDEDVLLRLYYDMGGTVGLMLYGAEHPQQAEASRLARFLLEQRDAAGHRKKE